jgi:hypothetical protein
MATYPIFIFVSCSTLMVILQIQELGKRKIIKEREHEM